MNIRELKYITFRKIKFFNKRNEEILQMKTNRCLKSILNIFFDGYKEGKEEGKDIRSLPRVSLGEIKNQIYYLETLKKKPDNRY